ncbi:MAG TPA: FG-GAP-like repeat-containing protein [Pyrinomonadaceae bacterium]|nr:FG-GAP-like repeat-containing protein [Pyrinomonadaceae bacterium]
MRIRHPYHHKTAAVLLVTFLLLTTACRPNAKLPAKSSRQYNEVVKAFYVGLAALQVGDDVRADAKLAEVTQLVPPEPAGWANWGLLALRQRNFEVAAERLERARSLASENDQIYYLLGLLESSRGRSAEAITALRKAVEINPKNLLAAYKLAEEIERQGSENSDSEYQQLIQKMLEVQPDNLAILLELGRISAKRGDAETFHRVVGKLAEHSAGWPAEVQQQMSALEAAASGSDTQAAATRIAFLRNVLVRVSEYRNDLSVIKPPPGEEAQPFTHFIDLESPTFTSAPADTAVTFLSEPVPNAPAGKWSWIGAISLNGEGAPAIVLANEKEVRIGDVSYPFPGASARTHGEDNPGEVPGVQPGRDGVVALDFNYDFKTDLVLAGSGGVRLLKQESANKFIDVTAQTKLPATVLTANYTGAWAADIDLDGDLDVVLGAEQALPGVLRNNGDGSFAEIHPFAGVSGLRSFVWADIDGDGDPDASLIDDGDISKVDDELHVFSNERSGQFKERQLLSGLPALRAISAGDLNHDGVLDLVAEQVDGRIIRLSDKNEGQGWEIDQIAFFDEGPMYIHRDHHLYVIDLDNNGGNDLLLTFSEHPFGKNVPGAISWLSDGENKFTLVHNANPPPGIEHADWIGPSFVFQPADVNGDGRLDLIGLSEGQPVQAINHGTKNYHWQLIRPRAAQASGDQRINSFGIGGEMEIRAGLLVQKQLVTGPVVHFGLGEQTGADVIRIVWPNGAVRAEFATKADQTILAEQRLKGSCPFLFAYNGKEMKFVKDTVPWSSAIGLRINTLGTARVEATEEWYKIGNDELVAREGYYDLRISAELWETYYYDQLALMTVDHPVGTDIFVDERFVIPPAKLAITTVETPHKIAQAVDDNGNDVTGIVSALDERYLDNFGRGRYQGVTRDHYVEIDLGNDVPESGPLWLIAKGWMHPTDSSINVAISQGAEVRPRALSMEVPDGKGGWIVAQPNLGFPAGRKKICLFDLAGVFRPNTPRRLRLRTNLEIFWDSIEWAKGLSDTQSTTVRINPAVADLHYRGYSVIDKPNASSPEIPDYNRMLSSKQIWRDLIGYYTRFGDVRNLLEKVDDRYVIMNAGDEMSLRFPEQPPPPAGWVRDYVFMGDGWIKDGDYNSTFSKTVLPLPYHAKQEYVTAPGKLEDEWVYKQHPEDWQKYHTRYVTPAVFQNALRSRKVR